MTMDNATIGKLLWEMEAKCDWWNLSSEGVQVGRFKFYAEDLEGRSLMFKAATLNELLAAVAERLH